MNEIGATSIGGEYSFISQYMRLHCKPEILERLRGSEDIDDIEDAILYSRFGHEFTHFFQNFTTTYGIFKTLNLRVAGLGIMSGCKALAEEGIDITLPINDMIPRNGRLSATWEMFLLIAKLQLQVEDFFEHSGLVEPHHRFRSVNQPNGMTSPAITTPKTGTTRLTAGTLLEFQALSQQIETLDRFDSIRTEFADTLIEDLQQRHQVRQIWLSVNDAFDNTKMTRGKHLLAYEMATLALCPDFPNDPIEGFRLVGVPDDTEEDKIDWEHVHPGWRFMKLLELIRDLKLSEPTTHADVIEIMFDLCTRLGWSKPSEALNQKPSDEP